METKSNEKPPEEKTKKKLLQREKGSFNRFDNLSKMNTCNNLTQRFEKASRLSKSFYDFVSIDKTVEKCTPHNLSYSYYFDANLENRKDTFSSNSMLFKEGVKRYNSVEGSLVSSSSSNDEEYDMVDNVNKNESSASCTNSYGSSENLTNTELLKSFDQTYEFYDKPSFVIRGSYDNDGDSHFYNIDYRDEKFNIERTMPDLNWNYLEKELQRAMEEINVKEIEKPTNKDNDTVLNKRNTEESPPQLNSLIGEDKEMYTAVDVGHRIGVPKISDMKPIIEENNVNDTAPSVQSIEDSINNNMNTNNNTNPTINKNLPTNQKQANYIDSFIKDKDVKYRSFENNGPIRIRDQVLKKMMMEAQRDYSYSYGSEDDDDDGYDDCDGKVRRLIAKGNLPVCFLNEINDEEEEDDEKNNEIKNVNVRKCSLTSNSSSYCASNVDANNNISVSNSNYQLHSEENNSSPLPSQYSTLSSNCSQLSEGGVSRSTLQPLPSLVPRRRDIYDNDNNSYCCCKEYSGENNCGGSACSKKSKFKIKRNKEDKCEKGEKYHHQFNDGFCARENFFNKQAKLQAQARLALAQVRPMAAMQSELQRKNRKMLQFRGLEGALDKRWCGGEWKLHNLNISQLQIIVNYLHDQINGLNKELISLLEEREQSGIIQDSILVDVEDFTRLAEEWEYKKMITDNTLLDDAYN